MSLQVGRMAEARPCLGRRGIGARAIGHCPFAPEFANQGLQAYGPENFATCFTLTFPHRNITGTCNARGEDLVFFARPTAGRPGPLSTGRRNRMERPSTRPLAPLRDATECRAGNPAFVQDLSERLRKGFGAIWAALLHGPLHASVTRCRFKSPLSAFCRMPVHCVAPRRSRKVALPAVRRPHCFKGCRRCLPAQKDGLPARPTVRRGPPNEPRRPHRRQPWLSHARCGLGGNPPA